MCKFICVQLFNKFNKCIKLNCFELLPKLNLLKLILARTTKFLIHSNEFLTQALNNIKQLQILTCKIVVNH